MRPTVRIDDLAAMVRAGMNDLMIAAKLGVSSRTVLRRRTRLGIPPVRRAITHGLAGTYKAGCRCSPCRMAATVHQSSGNATRRARTESFGLPDNVAHGLSAYRNWACRCDVCRAAGKVANDATYQLIKDRAKAAAVLA